MLSQLQLQILNVLEYEKMSEFWVFGYGSLMWRPGFEFIESVPARVHGYHRSLCVYSWHHRGTSRIPGLVLGLDKGGSCKGKAFRISSEDIEKVIEYLRDREQVTMVYKEAMLPIVLEKSKQIQVKALCYLINREHKQYAGSLSREKQLKLVRKGVGHSGRNSDYILNTVAHLEEQGIVDRNLEWLSKQLTSDD